MSRERLVWFILARVVVVSLFLASTIVLRARGTGTLGEQALDGITAILVATYGFSILSLLILKLARGYRLPLTYAQIIWDILFVTGLILYTGGISSPFSFLYLLAIISASVLLARREAFYTASLCAIIYGGIIDLQYYGQLVSIGLGPLVAQSYGTNYIFYTIFINIVAFFLTALLTGYLAERARESETELEKRAIDYEELERLNSAIVSNLTSGLLTVTAEGRIRVFNHYAETFTGITQEDAYDRDLYDIFPGFRLYEGNLSNVKRGVFELLSKNGRKLIVGFNSVPLAGKEEESAGTLINFQNLTQIKRMEENLKRSDRLAVIGELSARMAHEIRNPLAAISGSAQLIAQGDGIPEADRELFAIVLREADRLNGLITDFLAYARPSQPEKGPVNLTDLVGEIVSLVAPDRRFEQVRIINRVEPDFTLPIDPDQFRQVFWNLFVNAAEAMSEGGTITVDAERIDEIRSDGQQRSAYRITVADDGSGMNQETISRIFEPFYTSKASGTGLGLATVYRIIEAHGGRITVESAEGAGTIFIIFIPVQGNN
ncbi:PAS domain S-box protein [Geobacter hydrogenophilus]|uniref:histidine kinase n=1 Tax=Geobacter hydrogenophilus TaxID=40983 RepID=A0A9W6LB43_9BACT|nr:ATP-binding protein [Geobacter hydrogenophilus]MBT0895203.1 PAS domain S-box protein [Geobacter hydrogenophilus]GLI36615.1 PAS domain-containing sensor histidine kinase [Geobacter hydrogenophilus]